MLKTTLLNANEAGAIELKRYLNSPDLKFRNKEGINNWLQKQTMLQKSHFEVIQTQFPGSLYFGRKKPANKVPAAGDKMDLSIPLTELSTSPVVFPFCCVSIGVEKW